MSSPKPRAAASRASRSDGAEARSRLLHAALALFAEKGFAKTSTREIAAAAGTNIASISYYFGDKAGLYAATFTEPMGGAMPDLIAMYEAPELPIAQALRIFMAGYVEPLKHGDIVRQCMRLHLRELLEPTGQWATELDRDVKAPHEALIRVLCRHLQLAGPDDDVQRLAFAISGLATQLFVMRDVVEQMQPQLLEGDARIDTWADRLSAYALALVADEARRRRTSTTRAARPTRSRRAAPRTTLLP
ncbi:MAG: CerR family C-terminal domain-containing protein [Rhodocyclaceae bacterium]|nr:CerR family C-terminal domain-containing protein [Pseudomonadota bacterium]MDQ7972284.1 CerR family C-terminal domain-containing protein [Rhodocyclaceae bacterium]MDQ8000167.1 CerR family C-terminal domain-containing protein [Pseudomonadota bacterium]MDQ8016925.1 CerR family C-terminal domain-containing protein [Pseudomonadota bacterium]